MNINTNVVTILPRHWRISLGIHALLVTILGAFIIVQSIRSKTTTAEFEVLEMPKQSVAAAPRISPPKPKPKEVEKKAPPRAIFGMSRNSIVSNQGETVKAGNTVAKAVDDQKLKEDDPSSLPIPTDDYLVSRMPTLKSEVRIPYPPEAKEKKIQGSVVMDILIDQTGAVREAKLVEGPGAGLNEAALAAVKGFQFEPALMQERAVAVRIRYAYRFVLER